MKAITTHRLLVTRKEMLDRLRFISVHNIPDDATVWLLSGEDRIPSTPVDEEDLIEIEWTKSEE